MNCDMPSFIGEIYIAAKDYIPVKDRQSFADTIIGIAIENMTENDLKDLGDVDPFLRRAVKDQLGDDEESEDYDE